MTTPDTIVTDALTAATKLYGLGFAVAHDEERGRNTEQKELEARAIEAQIAAAIVANADREWVVVTARQVMDAMDYEGEYNTAYSDDQNDALQALMDALTAVQS